MRQATPGKIPPEPTDGRQRFSQRTAGIAVQGSPPSASLPFCATGGDPPSSGQRSRGAPQWPLGSRLLPPCAPSAPFAILQFELFATFACAQLRVEGPRFRGLFLLLNFRGVTGLSMGLRASCQTTNASAGF